jgi:2-dehydropantoate 2-reductase
LSANQHNPGVWVLGAGSVGCFVGGCLQAAGVPVVFIGRPQVLSVLRVQGLHLTDLDGRDQRLPTSALALHETPPASLAPPGLVLLCVKSGVTADAMASLANAVPPGTPVLSLQNGIRNAQTAQASAPALRVLAGMVPFNVAERAPGHLHRGTSGQLAAQDDAALRPWLPPFASAGLPLALHADMAAVQWAKLLLNLNNPVNALSGLPLQQQLLDRGFRRVLAALQREGLAALRAAGIAPAQLTPLPPQHLPTVLSLPTPLFRFVAARMLKMDSAARSSMADDLALGRATEVDALCGEVVQLARQCGSAAPLNEKMVALVKQWPASPQHYTAAALISALGLSA